MKQYLVQEGNTYLSTTALRTPDMVGLITPVTHDLSDAARFDDLETAKQWAKMANLSPYSKWAPVEVE